jgi:hypothetical protein
MTRAVGQATEEVTNDWYSGDHLPRLRLHLSSPRSIVAPHDINSLNFRDVGRIHLYGSRCNAGTLYGRAAQATRRLIPHLSDNNTKTLGERPCST